MSRLIIVASKRHKKDQVGARFLPSREKYCNRSPQQQQQASLTAREYRRVPSTIRTIPYRGITLLSPREAISHQHCLFLR
eukprot:scaffold8210_cov175-Amphora_coffeaeformis.AAC.3